MTSRVDMSVENNATQMQKNFPRPLLFLQYTRQPSTSRTFPHAASSSPATSLPPTTPTQKAEFAANLTAGVGHPIRYIHSLHGHFDPSFGNHVDDIDDPERTAAYGSENGHRSYGPQDEFQIKVTGDVGAVVGFAYGHGKDGIGNEPDDNHVGTYSAIVVLLLLSFADTGFLHLESIA